MIELPYPPTVNHYYTIARNRKILSKKGRAYKKAAQLLMICQGVEKGLKGPYSVWVQVRPPDLRKRDLDNILKPVLDSLTEYGVISDDSQITDLRVTKYNMVKGGQLNVLVTGAELL